MVSLALACCLLLAAQRASRAKGELAKERAQGKEKLPCFCSIIPALVVGLIMAIEFEISGLAGISLPVPVPAPAPVEPKRPGARAHQWQST